VERVKASSRAPEVRPAPAEVAERAGGERVYAQRRYWIGTLGPLLLLVALLLVTLLRVAAGETNRIDRLVLIVVPIVIIVNVLGMKQPRLIIDSPETLIFEGMGRRTVYRWRQMTALKVREFAFTELMFIRIEPSWFLGGAYWVDQSKYPGFAELRAKLLARERELHPERAQYQKTLTGKRRARRS